MGNLFSKRCSKCSCPLRYYQNDPGRSCQEHVFYKQVCLVCGSRNNESGNCYHTWV